ncbi:MAG: energy transducer TonB [Rhodanobacteraceae bacterium]
MNIKRQFKAAPIAVAVLLAGLSTSSAAAVRTVSPDQLPDYWILSASATELNVPNSGLNLEKPGCASASYTIGSDGVPRDIKLEKVVPNSDLGMTVVEAVKNFRYRPSADNVGQQPVHTYYTAQFNMRNFSAERKARLTAACDLPGYTRQKP